MATKIGPRKKHNSGTVRTTTNTQGGSRTRKTVTTKTGNYTRSRSVNRDGTVKTTTTHKAPSGFITRTSQSVGSKPSKPKVPKFIKANPFKVPKVLVSKPKIGKGKSGGSRLDIEKTIGGLEGEDFMVKAVAVGMFILILVLLA